MSRTNIDIDDDLMTLAMDVAGTTTKKDTVDEAMRRMVRKAAFERLVDSMSESYGHMTSAEIDAEREAAWGSSR